jgi:hypothetical protein
MPKKPVPGIDSIIDATFGWINAVNCQGIIFQGYDHIAVEPISSGEVNITGWVDDTEDFGDTRWATRWNLKDPAFDPTVGQVNTRQERTVWATQDAADLYFPGQSTRPWAEFVLPDTKLTFNGIWLPDSLFQQHLQVRQLHGWREWVK